MVCLLTPDHQVRFANRYFREFFGESNGRRCFEYVFNRFDPCPECQSFTPLNTRAPHHLEWDTSKGAFMDIYDFPFTDPHGSPLILEVDMDVTDRKRAETELAKHQLQELVKERTRELEATNAQLQAEVAERKQAEAAVRKSEAPLRAVLDALSEGVVFLNTDGEYEQTNAAVEAIVGYGPKTLADRQLDPRWRAVRRMERPLPSMSSRRLLLCELTRRYAMSRWALRGRTEQWYVFR